MAKFPKALGACIDMAYEARSARLKLQGEYEEKLEKLKAREQEIEAYIIDNFSVQQIGVAGGDLAKASVKMETHAQAEDEESWPKIWAWARKNDAFDLFYRRVNTKAYIERAEAGQKIPGIKLFQKKKLSLTKIGK